MSILPSLLFQKSLSNYLSNSDSNSANLNNPENTSSEIQLSLIEALDALTNVLSKPPQKSKNLSVDKDFQFSQSPQINNLILAITEFLEVQNQQSVNPDKKTEKQSKGDVKDEAKGKRNFKKAIKILEKFQKAIGKDKVNSSLNTEKVDMAVPTNNSATMPDTFKDVEANKFTKVNDNYYRGGKPEGDDIQNLADGGVKTIISLRSFDEDEKKQAEAAGMKYVNIPLSAGDEPTQEEIDTFLNAIQESNGPVYTHCTVGRDRTGVMTSIYQMEVNNMNPDDAANEMLSFRDDKDDPVSDVESFVRSYS